MALRLSFKPRSIHRRGGRAIIAATLFRPGLFFRRLLDGLGLDLLTGTCGFAYLRPASAGLSAFAHSAFVSSPWLLAMAYCKGRWILLCWQDDYLPYQAQPLLHCNITTLRRPPISSISAGTLAITGLLAQAYDRADVLRLSTVR